jgi:hypothetical protein
MRDDEREQASTYGYGNFFKGINGAVRKRRLYAALDRGREGLLKLKLDEADGEAIAGLAAAYSKSIGVISFFREKKVADLDTSDAVRQFLEVFGRYTAEGYLRKRKQPVSNEPSLLALAVSRAEIVELITDMQEAGRVAGDEADGGPDVSDESTVDEAVDLLADVLARYESAIPPVEEDGSIPERIQDVGIAKAAFLSLRAEDLREAAEGEADELKAATKELLARKLADEYAGREQEIADIVLGGPKRSEYASGLITRLMPLESPPQDLDEIADRLQQLKGRFFETRPAEWFCFRSVERVGSSLILDGELLGYQVRVTEVKDEARLQPQRQRETIRLRLRDGVAWAESNARRASALLAIRRVLKRTELATPKSSVTPPPAVPGDPFSSCDSRTLWILEWLYRELSSDPFTVDDHLMVSFERPPSAGSPSGDTGERKPTVTAVRLKGMLLIDHPEVCDLILHGRRVVDIELSLRVKRQGVHPQYYPRMKIRFGWANDHLVLISQDIEGAYDTGLHGRLVREIREAAPRTIDASYIELPMQRIAVNAGRTEADELGSVLASADGPQVSSNN